MAYTLRAIQPEEFDAFFRANNIAFGRYPSDEVLDVWRGCCELDRTLATFDGDQIVGTAGAFSFELTVPGPALLPAAGVSWVAVVPTHRRRGILLDMMRRQLLDVRERGEPLAVLLAAESGIYGRFGYGLASSVMDVQIERARAQLTDAALAAVESAEGRVRLGPLAARGNSSA
jgi:predicted N-acetyltransferase YhbS